MVSKSNRRTSAQSQGERRTQPKIKRVRPSRNEEALLIQPPIINNTRSPPRSPTRNNSSANPATKQSKKIYQPPSLQPGLKRQNDKGDAPPVRVKSPKSGFWRSNHPINETSYVDAVRLTRSPDEDEEERDGPPKSRSNKKAQKPTPPHCDRDEESEYNSSITGSYAYSSDPLHGLEEEEDIDDYREDMGSSQSTVSDHPEGIEYYEQMGTMSSTSDLEASDLHGTFSSETPDRPASPPIRGDYGAKSKKWFQRGIPILSKSESTVISGGTMISGSVVEKDPVARAFLNSEDDYLSTKQSLAYCTIALTSIQLLILITQLSMCGVAPLDINMMIGPYPDAFSQWGGKNPYKMLVDNEWWRMITPAFLHVGVLHLGANVFCQLNAVAMFEREWGWAKWAFVYIISTIGCSAFSNYFEQDSIAVGSSGSLMGMFAAKLAQVVTFSLFETTKVDVDDVMRLDQLSSVLCGLTLVSLLGSFTYIDWSGNMGGLLCGFLAGIIVFGRSLDGCCAWFWWTTIGLLGLGATIGTVMYFFVEEAEPEEALDDVCEYFRSFFPEGYECGCMWS